MGNAVPSEGAGRLAGGTKATLWFLKFSIIRAESWTRRNPATCHDGIRREQNNRNEPSTLRPAEAEDRMAPLTPDQRCISLQSTDEQIENGQLSEPSLPSENTRSVTFTQ